MESAASWCLPIRSNSPETGLKMFWKCIAQFSAPVRRPKYYITRQLNREGPRLFAEKHEANVHTGDTIAECFRILQEFLDSAFQSLHLPIKLIKFGIVGFCVAA